MLDHQRIMLYTRLARMDERGASAVEYGLLMAGIAAVIAVVVYAFGAEDLKGLFQSTCHTVATSAGSGGSC